MAVQAANGAAAANGDGSDRRSSASSSVKGAGGFVPLVSVVDFHHARGPEVERWFGAPDGFDPAAEYDWSLLPFMALSDGAHASTEDFSYFTLLRPGGKRSDDAEAVEAPTSLFGISCTRQMDASQLLARPADVTRSTVQKAVVVIADSPLSFGMLRERLSMVTKAWFAQREFSDVEILRRFQESLAEEKARGGLAGERPDAADGGDDRHLGLSLRELVREFRWQTLVLFKCCLLQPKMLFFGSRCERLCMMQFSLISLIPGLLGNLHDCAGPELNSYEKKLTRPSGVRTSDRNSLLAYMGLPLQIFGKGSLFGPYTPLQQLDILADFGTKSYIVGSTNSLLLQQRDRYSDILINLDEGSINVTSTSLKAALHLSSADRRWIESVTAEVNDTWDDANPGRPKTMGYRGSEESIRLQFQDYILSLLAAVKYRTWLARHRENPRAAPLPPHIEGDPSTDFNPDFVDHWARTENYRIWQSHTDAALFDITDPKHPCAGGGLGRLAQQMQDLGLDERFAAAGVVVGKGVAAGREKASAVISKLYADMEALREAQRRKAEEQRQLQQQQQPQQGERSNRASIAGYERNGSIVPAVDFSKAGQAAQAVGSKAGAFASSWAAWAGEKRKAWGRSSSGNNVNSPSSTPTSATAPVGGGWSLVGRSSKRNTSGSFASSTLSSSSDAVSSPLFPSERDDASTAGGNALRSPSSIASAGVAPNTYPASDSSPISPLTERRPLSPSSAPAGITGIDGQLATSGNSNVGSEDEQLFKPRDLDAIAAAATPAAERSEPSSASSPPAVAHDNPTPVLPLGIDMKNEWAEPQHDFPSPIVERRRTPEPDIPPTVGSKIILRP